MPMPGIVILPDGEEIYLGDMLIGIDNLPPRQRQAFELICLQGYTETAATKIMLPNSKWSTPCQQYADTALERMIKSYDEKQAGTYVHTPYVAKSSDKVITKAKSPSPKPQRRQLKMATTDTITTISEVLRKHLTSARDELEAQRILMDQEIAKVEALLGGAAAVA
jgi:hypothetical protein